MLDRLPKPHIRRIRNNWYVFANRKSRTPIAVTSRFKKLPRIGPWRPAEIQCEFYGDAKPS
jgi:hypothetical protein